MSQMSQMIDVIPATLGIGELSHDRFAQSGRHDDPTSTQPSPMSGRSRHGLHAFRDGVAPVTAETSPTLPTPAGVRPSAFTSSPWC
jgi:hypothetical protein